MYDTILLKGTESAKKKGATTMYVIWKEEGYKMTTEENYNAYIRNERKVSDWSAFNSADEIIEYCVKWFGGKAEDYKEV